MFRLVIMSLMFPSYLVSLFLLFFSLPFLLIIFSNSSLSPLHASPPIYLYQTLLYISRIISFVSSFARSSNPSLFPSYSCSNSLLILFTTWGSSLQQGPPQKSTPFLFTSSPFIYWSIYHTKPSLSPCNLGFPLILRLSSLFVNSLL